MSKFELSSLLNEELIKRALQSYHNLNNLSALEIKACDFKLSPANGENFCSEIYLVEVQYEINGNAEQKSLIAKILIPEIADLGSNEFRMLNTILPGMEKCLSTAENDNKLYAKCLLSESDKEEFYILENLNSLGYYCADRCKGLDYEHAEIVMKKLAKFHAASMIYNKKFPDIVKSLLNSGFEKGACDEVSQVITYGGFEYVADMIKNWPSYENLSHKVRSVIKKYNGLAYEVVNSKNSIFNVINHGDLWVNNFLYKYSEDNGRPTDVLFIDFQNCFWGSCGVDINWFLNSSLELQVLKDKRLQLIECYYEALSGTLKKENYPQLEIPSKEDVLMEIKRCEFIGFYIALCEFPMFALDRCKSQGFDNNTFTQSEKMNEIRVLMYDNPRVRDTLAYSLKYFEEINLL
ncbi:uncharacterized protein LOC119606166 [Lucilia sericata]|uniref:uncharacterized protein LOC119606166 n=1 Tax=Lucilia sericata TaxID=13632 RepID=UPI0018A83DF2|nr:uncharacterized protein LOC119606166 [Lucilia sericata]